MTVCGMNGPAPIGMMTPTEDADRLRHFAGELDALKRRTLARIGEEDVAYVRRLDRLSRRLEIAGRALIHASFERGAFFAGVLALAVHKQL